MQFKVKGISMSVFSEEDIVGLGKMGNTLFNTRYLARIGSQAPPNSNDVNKFKEYLKNKYVEKRWFTEVSAPAKLPVVGVAQSTASSSASGFGDDLFASAPPSKVFLIK